MTMNSYDAGEFVYITASFAVNGVVMDPATVTASVLKPDGTTLTPTPVKDSTGNYHAALDTTGGPQGTWRYKWSGTSPAQSAGDGQFYLNVPF